MKADSPDHLHNERETQLTALLLGELSAEEAAEVRKQMEADPALAALHARLAYALGLVREAMTSMPQESEAGAVPLRLSDVRREQLLQAFKTAKPQFATSQPRARRWVLEMS